MSDSAKPRIAYFAGSNATIHSIPPLVTSNKARAKYGLAPLTNPDGTLGALRRAAAAAAGAAGGRLCRAVQRASARGRRRRAVRPAGRIPRRLGKFSPASVRAPPTRRCTKSSCARTMVSIPCRTWRARPTAAPGMPTACRTIAPAHQSRQPFFPDGSRPVEEIDRLGIGEHGTGNLISAYAEIDFFRVLPASGYKKGLPAGQRTDIGEGDIPPEALGKDFFPYRPPHLGQHPPRLGLARIANIVQAALAERHLCGRDLDARQPAHRRDALLAQPAARHDAAAVRQLGPACARHDQQ